MPFPSINAVPEGWSFYAYDTSKTLLKKLLPSDFDAISVKYINKFIPKLILPALSMGIFLAYFLIKFSSLVNPVVPITTFLSFDAIFRTSKVHFGTVKSIIKFAFLKV